MEGVMPDKSKRDCANCPYYSVKEQHFGDQCFYICNDVEALELTAKTMNELKEENK